MTFLFTQFCGKDLTTKSDGTVIINYYFKCQYCKIGGQKDVVALKNLKFVVMLVYFFIQKNLKILTYDLDKTQHHQLILQEKGKFHHK